MLQACKVRLHICPCRKQDDWNMAGAEVLFECLAKLKPVFFRHHHIADDEVGNAFQRLVDPFLTVNRHAELVILSQDRTQVLHHT